ncbi:mitochondrial carrier protein [Chrysochromulina tobinii]|uniref:Mitochondrial carrier protein n=1 Tax=Chrysochromulina tobinii TaxID=1460289 RepID=A0A0M0JPZ7_9EUKA|nr:mitochondrial carrier protein [Chrysochromulina tobinii]|eukprot:KOO28328.1 mitochondrial carrier protein [Chrysochromulina sp. CCMP291]
MVQAGGGPPQSALIRRDSRTLRHWVSGKPVEDPPKDKAGNLLLAGAAAGGVSKFCTAPIDRVKLMYQVSPDRVFSVSAAMSTAQRIVNTSGVMGLWRGNSIAVLRDVPYAAIIFSSYAMIEESICGHLQRSPDVWSRSAAGGTAGAIATCLTYPLDVLRARFGAEWEGKPRYGSYYQGVREILRSEGAAALFAGLRPTLLGIMPYSALSFAAFETFKAALHAWNLYSPYELSVAQKLAAGGVAGLFAQSSTYPLHVVRRRMQAGHGGYHSTWHALRSIYVNEGVAGGLYKGLTLTFVKGPLQSAIGFTVNDYCKKVLGERYPMRSEGTLRV